MLRISNHTVRLALAALTTLWALSISTAHEPHHRAHESTDGHRGPTYEVTPSQLPDEDQDRLVLHVLDDQTGEPTAARIRLSIDGQNYIPPYACPNGLRFVSIHAAKRQQATIVTARGTGPVTLPLPRDIKQLTASAAKGYQYTTTSESIELADSHNSPRQATITLRLKRWTDISDQNWHAADEHLHYERSDPKHDRDWLHLLAADNLRHAHFMVLQGGNLPGIWAQQYAYGKAGQAGDGTRLLVPGEEVRDARQGHINLLGLGELIEPISTGGIGSPPVPFHYPAHHDVYQDVRRNGGIGGPAHGGALARNSTAIVDSVLGAAEFFEIANTHLYKTDLWYRVMNCGYLLPPAAGTDLPNFPFRDPWQPFFGETRMYVRAAQPTDFDAWKQSLRRGRVFVSSGPILQLSVNGAGPGERIELPHQGGEVDVEAVLSFPRALQSFHIIQQGKHLDLPIERDETDGVHRWTIRTRLAINRSCWLAAHGLGPVKQSLLDETDIRQYAMAHSAAIEVLVGDQPITSPEDARFLIEHMTVNQEFYRNHGRFEEMSHRERMLELFDMAIEKLKPQINR